MSVGGIYNHTGQDYWVVADDGTYCWSGYYPQYTPSDGFTVNDTKSCIKLAPKELSQWNDK